MFLTVFFFWITDELLPFDLLSILILDIMYEFIMYLLVFSLVLVLIYWSYFSNVTYNYIK